jgi:arsenate reductase (thioredoxin)
MSNDPLKVLVLCTGNSARSVLCEYLLREKGRGRFEVHSAGSRPTGRVNPLAVRVLGERYGIDASEARSKSWDEFKDVEFDLVITVCDNARESCPIWPGHPVVGHWSSPDPADAAGTEDERFRVFEQVAAQIASRVDVLCGYSGEKLAVLDAGEMARIAGATKLDGESNMKR